MLEQFKKLLASATGTKTNSMSAVPTDRFGMVVPVNIKYQSTIPRNPTYHMLRNFAKHPIVSRPITAVQDRISRLQYEIRPKVKGRKYTKQIKIIRNIIDNPNIDQTRRRFESMIIQDMLTLDAGVFEVCKSEDPNHPLYLYPIDGATIQHTIPIEYTNPFAQKYMQSTPDGNVFFRRDEMCYLRKDCFTDRPYGISPVQKAYDYIKYLLDASESASDNVNTKTAGMIISLGENFTEEQTNKFREYFSNEVEGSGRIPIVGGTKGLTTGQIRSFTEDMVYKTWLDWLTTVIAMAFPFPVSTMINVSADRSTKEEIETQIMEELVKPYASLLEDAYNTHVINLLGYGDILEFHYVYEDSENMKTQKWNRLNSAFTAGAITENEWRDRAGFEPSSSKYANLTGDERKAQINKDLGVNGFNGLGNIKDNSESKTKTPNKGGEDSG